MLYFLGILFLIGALYLAALWWGFGDAIKYLFRGYRSRNDYYYK